MVLSYLRRNQKGEERGQQDQNYGFSEGGQKQEESVTYSNLSAYNPPNQDDDVEVIWVDKGKLSSSNVITSDDHVIHLIVEEDDYDGSNFGENQSSFNGEKGKQQFSDDFGMLELFPKSQSRRNPAFKSLQYSFLSNDDEDYPGTRFYPRKEQTTTDDFFENKDNSHSHGYKGGENAKVVKINPEGLTTFDNFQIRKFQESTATTNLTPKHKRTIPKEKYKKILDDNVRQVSNQERPLFQDTFFRNLEREWMSGQTWQPEVVRQERPRSPVKRSQDKTSLGWKDLLLLAPSRAPEIRYERKPQTYVNQDATKLQDHYSYTRSVYPSDETQGGQQVSYIPTDNRRQNIKTHQIEKHHYGQKPQTYLSPDNSQWPHHESYSSSVHPSQATRGSHQTSYIPRGSRRKDPGPEEREGDTNQDLVTGMTTGGWVPLVGQTSNPGQPTHTSHHGKGPGVVRVNRREKFPTPPKRGWKPPAGTPGSTRDQRRVVGHPAKSRIHVPPGWRLVPDRSGVTRAETRRTGGLIQFLGGSQVRELLTVSRPR